MSAFTGAQLRGLQQIARQGYIDGRRVGGSIVRMQDRLRHAGLIERNPDYNGETDRRPWRLTAIGNAEIGIAGTSLADDKHADRVRDGREAINGMLEAQGKV